MNNWKAFDKTKSADFPDANRRALSIACAVCVTFPLEALVFRTCACIPAKDFQCKFTLYTSQLVCQTQQNFYNTLDLKMKCCQNFQSTPSFSFPFCFKHISSALTGVHYSQSSMTRVLLLTVVATSGGK